MEFDSVIKFYEELAKHLNAITLCSMQASALSNRVLSIIDEGEPNELYAITPRVTEAIKALGESIEQLTKLSERGLQDGW